MSSPTTLWQALRRSARSAAGAPALLSPQQGLTFSWSELHDSSLRLSCGLQSRGVGEGDVVVTDLPNVAEGILLHLACARLVAAVATAKVRGHLHVLLPRPSPGIYKVLQPHIPHTIYSFVPTHTRSYPTLAHALAALSRTTTPSPPSPTSSAPSPSATSLPTRGSPRSTHKNTSTRLSLPRGTASSPPSATSIPIVAPSTTLLVPVPLPPPTMQ